MKERNYDDIDINAYRQRFHKYAYLRQAKTNQSTSKGPIESIFDRDISTTKHSDTGSSSSAENDAHIPKTTGELISNLLGLEPPEDEKASSDSASYKIPTKTFQESHEVGTAYIAPSPSKKVVRQLASSFINHFTPWLQRYKVKTNKGWITNNDRLHFSSICKGIQGDLTLAFFSSINTKVLGIDIDEHNALYRPAEVLQSCRETYLQVKDKFGYSPSLLVQSSRGFHLFYLLTERVYWEYLHNLARKVIGGMNVELLPTPYSTLRIPKVTMLLNPSTLKPVEPHKPEYTDWDKLQAYSPSQLFGKDWKEQLYQSTRTKGRSSQERPTSSKPMDLKLLEHTLLPFRNGRSYKPTFEFTVACNRLGMSREEIIHYLQELIEQSPSYTGGLKKNSKELEDRVDHILGKDHTSASLPCVDTKAEILGTYKPVIEHLTTLHPFAPQRNKPVKQFLESLILWREWHDKILTNPEATSLLDGLYPFYRKNRKEGFYPLPSALLKRWHPKYYELIHWLEEIEVLQESPYPYSKSAHICKYYSISFEHLEP